MPNPLENVDMETVAMADTESKAAPTTDYLPFIFAALVAGILYTRKRRT